MTTLPPYEARWGFPVKSSSLLNKEFQGIYAAASDWFKVELSAELAADALGEIAAALDTVSGHTEFDAAVEWFVATQYWRQSSLSATERSQLPLWWWETALAKLETGARFEALAHVSEESFGRAMDEWVVNAAGIPLAMINHWRKKRTDALGMIPTDTFTTLYGTAG